MSRTKRPVGASQPQTFELILDPLRGKALVKMASRAIVLGEIREEVPDWLLDLCLEPGKLPDHGARGALPGTDRELAAVLTAHDFAPPTTSCFVTNHPAKPGNREADALFSRVRCLFADASAHWVWAGDAKSFLNDPATRGRAFRELRSFVEHFETMAMDGFCIFLKDTDVASDGELGILLKEFLTRLGEDSGTDVLAGVEDETWRLRAFDEQLLVLVFSSHYPEKHARRIAGPGSACILVQPDRVFDRYATRETGLIAPSLRQKVRRAYRQAGMSYDFELSNSDDQRAKFVKASSNDATVMWWKA